MIAFLRFIALTIVIGLAAAFVLVWWQPDLLQRNGDSGIPVTSAGTDSYSGAVARAAPSVVSIYTTTMVTTRVSYGNPYYRRFFGDRLVPQARQGLGSGVVVSEDGYLLTNYHVVGNADDIRVSLYDGRIAEAEIVGTDPETDLAVLKIPPEELPVAPFRENGELEVGDVVLAIGNALGLSHTVTLGIVSATGRSDLRVSLYEDFIQTDAAINSGNSGGALVDAQGRLIGINTSTLSRSIGAQGISFAIPIDVALDVMQQIIDYGSVQRGWIGVQLGTPPLQLNNDGTNQRSEGARITDIQEQGPAWQAGLRTGDIILELEDTPVEGPRELLLDISRMSPGETIELLAERDGQTFTTSMTLIQQPPVRF